MLGLARFLTIFAFLACVNGAPKHHKRHFHHHHENSKRHFHQHKDSKVLENDPLAGTSCDSFVTLGHGWSQGQQAKMEFTVPQAANGWKITVRFHK